jgi:hypothetical protein
MTRSNNPARNAETAELKEPVIRAKQFGLGKKREPIAEPAAKARSGSLLSKLGLGRKSPVAAEVVPTSIKGSPVQADRKGEQATAPTPSVLAPSFPGEDDDAILMGLFGDTPVAPSEASRPPPQRATAQTKPVVSPMPPETPPLAPVAERKLRRLDRSDLTLAALGVVLGTICAVFPWYIFLNQEKFGVRSFVFDSSRGDNPRAKAAVQPNAVGKAFPDSDVPKLNLDFFPTATLPMADEEVRTVPSSEQPFPADLVPYHLVHVANGRAMIEDTDGLWVVQRGSRLPDGSRVVTIEKRNGDWVLKTTRDAVITLQH